MRTCPSPEGPKLAPGVTTTPAFSMSSSQNAMESVRPPGSLAHTNIEPCALGRSQPSPQDRRTGHRGVLVLQTLRLDLIARTVQARDGGLLNREEHTKVDLAAQLGKGRDHILATDQKPMRAPVTLNDLESEKNSTPTSSAPGYCKEAAAGLAVKHDVGVRVIMDDQQIMLAGKGDNLLVDLGRAHRADRVRGQRHDHVLGTIGNLGSIPAT